MKLHSHYKNGKDSRSHAGMVGSATTIKIRHSVWVFHHGSDDVAAIPASERVAKSEMPEQPKPVRPDRG